MGNHKRIENPQLIDIQKKLLNQWEQNETIKQEIDKLRGVDESYETINHNIKQLYYQIKAELWSRRISVEIDSFQTPKFKMSINYKELFKFVLYFDWHGKNATWFRYDLTRIKVVKAIDGYDHKLNKGIKRAVQMNDLRIFIDTIIKIIHVHKF